MAREDGAEFLASLYDPPLKRFPSSTGNAHLRARAAAWGAAVEEWLAGFEKEKTRAGYCRALRSLWNWHRKLPWEVRQGDIAGWLADGLAGKTEHTKAGMLRWVRLFYRLACKKTWTSPAGRKLRLCREDPTEGVVRPKEPWFPKTEALHEAEWERLAAAFDVETSFGRRDKALFTVILETGLHLREAVLLRLRDVADWETFGSAICYEPTQGDEMPEASRRGKESHARPVIERMRRAGWEAVQEYIKANGRTAEMGPEDFVFTPLEDVAGLLAQRHPQGWEKKPLSANGARDALAEYAAWAGLEAERATPEALRYTGARRLVEAGASPEEVGAYLRMKKLDRVRHLMRRLKASEQTPGRATREDDGSKPVESRKRNKPGAQPGNDYRLKHGLYAARYSLKRLGIHHHSLKDIDPARLPETLVELRWMIREVFELPDESAEVMLKKLRKISYMAVMYSRLYLMEKMRLREEEEEEREDFKGLEEYFDF